jgi:HlyD family secretion protein
MFGRARGWIKAHPKWSIAFGVIALLILYLILKPTPKTYEYVTQAADRGEVVRRVTASGKLRARSRSAPRFRARSPTSTSISTRR